MIVEEERVVKIDNEAESVEIPPTVKFIDQFACYGGSLNKLNLEETKIKIIGRYAFSYCNLYELVFPASLEEIYEGAFQHCEKIEKIYFPPDSNLRKIGSKAFQHCKSLMSINFPNLLEYIGDFSFDDCISLKRYDLQNTKIRHVGYNAMVNVYDDSLVQFPGTVSVPIIVNNFRCQFKRDEEHTPIKKDGCGYYVVYRTIFANESKNNHIFIRRGVERIARNCFASSNISSITIPASVTKISDNAFALCINLEKLQFAKNSRLKEIGVQAFSYCCGIRKVKFPVSLEVLGKESFQGCESLEEVVFPSDSKLRIIKTPFFDTRIKHLSLPASVKAIGDVLIGMHDLESVFINNEYFRSNKEGNAIFSADGSELICIKGNIKKFDIPEGVKVIKKHAFMFSLLESILVIPSSVEIIEAQAFQGCNALKIIEFAKGSKIRHIDVNALHFLDDLILNNENYVKMDNGVVLSKNPHGIVFVPKNLTEIQIDSNIEVIFSSAFGFSKIRRINLPRSLKMICQKAFCGSQLESIMFEDGTELDCLLEFALSETRIESLKLPIITKEVGHAFGSDLKTIEFPCHFKPDNIEQNAMSNCSINVICHKSTLPVIASLNPYKIRKINIIEDN